jgi:aspartyl-tRNA(Asn)/glutamyl-tRNA(Gln) amidotransferase subunit A
VQTLGAIAAALRRGDTTAAALTAAALERIADPAGQGAVAFLHVDRAGASAAAAAADARRAARRPASALDGIPVSVKDLFDVAGQVTAAGSRVLSDGPPAARDAPAVARLRAAGAVLVGRTNMTEFAFSGVGLNPHFGTPLSPYDRAAGRIAGGSSSGAAVSVAEGMAAAALGSDTGGSLRIPAAFCGLAAFKPTATRVPRAGMMPLSTTLDSVGAIAPSVACCAVLDAVLAGESVVRAACDVRDLRLAVPRGVLLDELDRAVAAAFARALQRLAARGASVVEVAGDAIAAAAASGVQGVVASAEAWALHRPRFAADAARYDRRVAVRVRAGASISAPEYVQACRLRADLAASWAKECMRFDVMLAPTVACVPPPLAPLARDDRAYARADLRCLRNTSVVNALDGCALTLPCHREGEAPVGLMAFAPAGRDRALLAVGMALEAALACSGASVVP